MPPERTRGSTEARSHAAEQQSRIVTFANRLPVTRAGGGWRVADGGLVTALRPAMASGGGTWVGWSPSGDLPDELEGLPIELVGVQLSRRLADGFYHGFANRALWPLLHGLVEQPAYERRQWDAYREANRRFAEADVEGPGLRWVHDYQLMLLPQLLRERGARGPIGFFLHVPFPPPEIFLRLPWRYEILRGLLGADVISFHTEDYSHNFLRCCAVSFDDVEAVPDGLRLGDGRVVVVRANPISIDAAGLAQQARSPEVERHLARLQRRFRDTSVLLGVDRLDYTKGIPERLLAIERLLELNPERRGSVTFVQLAVPSRGEIREYEELRSTVERLVGRINGRFTEASHQPPVHYLYRRVPFDELLAYFRLADVCLVTPLIDGMNLVAKEFASVQGATGGSGALVLSEFTGASRELRLALGCNPYDVDGLAGTIELALELPAQDRRRRIETMADAIAQNDVFAWLGRELDAMRGSGSERERPSSEREVRTRPRRDPGSSNGSGGQRTPETPPADPTMTRPEGAELVDFEPAVTPPMRRPAP
ncbi:MAG: alpha,alpha-trehalose-phosphate synthase (UDP-forming) [Gaiella sp.]